MRLKDNKKSFNKKRVIILVSVVVGLLLILGILEKTGVTNFVHMPKEKATTASEYTKGETSNSSNSKTSQNTDKNSNTDSTAANTQGDVGSEEKTTNGSTSTTLIAPSGDFVSDYQPNLSNSPHPNTVNSVCNTTPGAQCMITFTMGSTTKSLPKTTADAGGSVYWTWKLQDIGLTAGTWKIQAVATLSGKTATTNSPLSLEVKQ